MDALVIGYIFTTVLAIALVSRVASLFLTRKDLKHALSGRVNLYTLIALAAIVIFFIVFSLLYVSPTEQLYFDENIYQGIALNILQHGNAVWCQYGTGLVQTCFSNAVYHDLIGYPFLIAIAFGIFGVSVATAYGLQLLIGALSIVFMFLLASLVFERKDAAVASTLVLALIPQLFIWSRTQAIPDLALMTFSTATFFLFVLFAKQPKLGRFIPFASALTFTIYMRIEGILLLPIFAILFFLYGEEGVVHTLRSRAKLALDAINNNTNVLLALLFFFVLIVPDLYYLSMQAANPSYGQDYTGQQVFSFANFMNNIGPNVQFFLGTYNAVSYFPLVFPVETTILAIIGVILLYFSKSKNRIGLLLLPIVWIGAFHLFYDFFYAGAATFGVDDRFMLQIVPGLALLAGFSISEIGRIAGTLSKRKLVGYAASALVAIVLVVYPFYTLIPNITLTPSQMPQQSVIHDALTFFYGNYSKVPTNCLVYSFTPDLWYEFNRSAAQISYLGSTDPQFLNNTKGYSCKVIDYGYWCSVPPYKDTSCKGYFSSYNLVPLAVHNNTAKGENFGFYEIVNKTN